MPAVRIEKKSDITPYIRVKNVPNPHLIYPELKTLLVERCEIQESNINEEIYDHTKSADMDTIKSVIKAKFPLDKISYIEYKLEIKIEMRPLNKGEIKFVGDAGVKVQGKVITKHPQETWFQKSLFGDIFRGLYQKILYADAQEGFIDLCSSRVIKLRDEITSFFNLLPKMS